MELPRRFEAEPPHRVLVVGPPGSGRLSLATLVAGRFALPAIDIAAERGEHSEAAWRDLIAARVAEADWAMAGADFETIDLASKRAEWFVWLDLPVSACVVALCREAIARRLGRKSAKRSNGAGDASVWAHIKRVAHFTWEMGPKIISTIERERRNRTIFILRTKRDVSEFIARLPGISGTDDNPVNRGKPVP